MYGLVDYDIQTSTSKTFLIPNLEIMKLASYYMVEENTFCKLIDLNETELSSYEKIFFFSELDEQPTVPLQFLRANNVVFGGTAFTNGIYQPFENNIIDFTLPRTTIYKDFLKQRYSEGVKTKALTHILDDTYYRNYAGETRLPLPAILPNKRVILYDKEFFYPDWKKTLDIISSRKCSSIIRIHPIVCNTLGQYFSAREYPKMNRSNSFILDLNVPLEDTPYFFKKYKNKFLADVVLSSNVFLPLGGTRQTKLLYAKDIVYILNFLYCFWSRNIPIKIKYLKPKIGVHNPFHNLCEYIERWSWNYEPKKLDRTILESIPKKKDYDYVRDQYEEFLKYKPNDSILFKRNHMEIRNGGLWRYDR